MSLIGAHDLYHVLKILKSISAMKDFSFKCN